MTVQRLFGVMTLLGLIALACSGTAGNMQILDEPVFVCPSSTPRSTDTPAPTDIQPTIYASPAGWATRTRVPGCIWNGFVCATNTPAWGGVYTTPGYATPGSTSTPRPTTTLYPTPTIFVMRPPQEFFTGDALYTGGFSSPANARLRLLNINFLTASIGRDGISRNIAQWQVEIKNMGSMPYDVFPAWQIYVSTVETMADEQNGIWGASRAAMTEAGLSNPLEAVTLSPGETRLFTLAAYIPAGNPIRFTFALDPTTRADNLTPPLPGENLLVWTNETNTICTGDLSEPPVLPTPVR